MQVEDKRWRLFRPIFTTGGRLSATVHMTEEELLVGVKYVALISGIYEALSWRAQYLVTKHGIVGEMC